MAVLRMNLRKWLEKSESLKTNMFENL